MAAVKIVLTLDLQDDRKKQRALKVFSNIHGIDTIAVNTKDDKMTVVGTVDPIHVVGKLRSKLFPTAQIFSVGPAKEQKKDDASKPPYWYPTPPYHSPKDDPNSCVIC